MPAETPAEISLRHFADMVDVNESSVRKAVKNGRLERSIGYRNGRPYICDVAEAKREWRDNFDPSYAR